MKLIIAHALPLLLLAAPAAAQERATLTAYVYDSFVSEWGPGPQIEAGFEAQCGCDLNWVTAGDGAALLSRLQLEGERTRADVVVGLDNALMARAKATGLFAPHGIEAEYDLPMPWTSETFVPFDWGQLAFVHRAGFAPPASLEALADSDATILIQDPRASTPGLGLALWVASAYPGRAEEIWAGLADNVVTVTPGWSEAYGLFQQGEADMVLSYATSPAYHRVAEGDDGFDYATFDEGHWVQIEVAAMLAASDQPDLARDFLRYLTSPEAQAVLPGTNWMYPVAAVPLPEGFETAPPPPALIVTPEEAEARTEGAIAAWRAGLSR